MNELHAKAAVLQSLLSVTAEMQKLADECLELGHICHDECDPPQTKLADDCYMVSRSLKDCISVLKRHQ